MTPQVQDWIKKVKKDFIKSPGKVLEVGSLNINGSVRQFFEDAKVYIGIDMMAGEGVDKVMDSHDILKIWQKGTFDTVICLEMLEHDKAFWITIENMHKVLKKAGLLVASVPTFGFPLHRYPKDYFRFGEDACKEIIFKKFKILNLLEVRDEFGAPGICCIGKKL